MESFNYNEKRQNLQKRRIRRTLGHSLVNGFSDIESGSTISQPTVRIKMCIV